MSCGASALPYIIRLLSEVEGLYSTVNICHRHLSEVFVLLMSCISTKSGEKTFPSSFDAWRVFGSLIFSICLVESVDKIHRARPASCPNVAQHCQISSSTSCRSLRPAASRVPCFHRHRSQVERAERNDDVDDVVECKLRNSTVSVQVSSRPDSVPTTPKVLVGQRPPETWRGSLFLLGEVRLLSRHSIRELTQPRSHADPSTTPPPPPLPSPSRALQ